MIVQLIEWVNSIILTIGYPGIMLLMFFESTMVPIPSEIVMPFAGYLAAQGKLSFFLVVLLSGVASLIGSIFSYSMGQYGGIPLIKKWGHYVLLDEDRLKWTQKWFKKRGEITIFISRFIPVVRHLISLPAGVGKMNKFKFCLYTFVGATIWNGILVYLGYYFGENYLIIHEYSKIIDYVVVVLIALALVYYVWHFVHLMKKKTRQ
ncbi:DedA family protein [Candidatus Woesearchaeota archaeon]|nr:DedA family protein [Candidatus Woesearchaeota archaeon]